MQRKPALYADLTFLISKLVVKQAIAGTDRRQLMTTKADDQLRLAAVTQRRLRATDNGRMKTDDGDLGD